MDFFGKRKRSLYDMENDSSSKQPRTDNFLSDILSSFKRKRSDAGTEANYGWGSRPLGDSQSKLSRYNEKQPESYSDQLAEYRNKHSLQHYTSRKSATGGKRKRSSRKSRKTKKRKSSKKKVKSRH